MEIRKQERKVALRHGDLFPTRSTITTKKTGFFLGMGIANSAGHFPQPNTAQSNHHTNFCSKVPKDHAGSVDTQDTVDTAVDRPCQVPSNRPSIDSLLLQNFTSEMAVAPTRKGGDISGAISSSYHLLGCVGDMPVSGRYSGCTAESRQLAVAEPETCHHQANHSSSKLEILDSFDEASGAITLVAPVAKTNLQMATEFVSKVEEACRHFQLNDVELFDTQRMTDQFRDLYDLQEDLSNNFGVLDVSIDIGFHYTNAHCLDAIRIFGLCSAKERGIHAHKSFGAGIYTGNNPMAFSRYGSVGIMVARLKGNCSPVVSRITELDHHSQLCFNTVIGNKKGNLIDPTHQFDEVVLQQRTQVVPLVSFHKTWNDVCPHFLHTLHVKIQSIIDQYFNDGHQTRAGYYENNDQMKELPFRKRRIRRIRKSELKRIRTDKRNVAQRPVSSPLAVMTHKTVSPPAVVPPLLSLDQGQNHLSLSSAPPRLFDPTSPLWDDFPPPLPSHSTRLPVEASQSFDLAPGHGGPSRIVHLGDTTLPPPFPNSWSFNAQAQGIQQPPQIDEWGFPIDSKPCKTN